MAKRNNQKIKLITLIKFLEENTDQYHYVSMDQIITYLNSQDISSERKSIYSDMEELRLLGYDVVYEPYKGYYINSRLFSDPEVQMLVDIVSQTKSISSKDSERLVNKLSELVSVHQRHSLKSSYKENRVKSSHDSISNVVDSIRGAINSRLVTLFRYYTLDENKNKAFHNNGKYYHVYPYDMKWDNMNYYLIGFDRDEGKLKYFRVDRIEDIHLSDDKFEMPSKDELNKIDENIFSNFSMFQGTTKYVSLKCKKSMSSIIIDRFGKHINLVPCDEDHFRIHIPVSISTQFYGWLTGLGSNVILEGPEDERKRFLQYLRSYVNEYSKN